MTMQALARAGLVVGDALIGADPTNPDGHFEDVETVRAHDAWLAAAGTDWRHAGPAPAVDPDGARAAIGAVAARLDAQAPAGAAGWGVKDPRATLFVDAWLEALPDLRVVVAYRHFAACADSLRRRQASELLRRPSTDAADLCFWTRPTLALESWLAHSRIALAAATRHPERCAFVSQEGQLAGADAVGALEARWGLGLDATAETGVDAAKAGRATRIELPDDAPRGELETVWTALQDRSLVPAPDAPETLWLADDADGAREDGARTGAVPEALREQWDRLGVAA